MPNHWLVKTEPSTYSFSALERDRSTVWDGVTNSLALKHLRAMASGDEVLVYHTGEEKRVVGIAAVVKGPYPDHKQEDPKLTVVDLAPVRRLPQPVTLAAIKADPRFKDFALVRMARLSVMPVTDAQWSWILEMAATQ